VEIAAAMLQLREVDADVCHLAVRQRDLEAGCLNMVAASCPVSPAVRAALSLGFGGVTAEGYPGARYHPGADVVDGLEELCVQRARQLYGASHVNVQPLSASNANLALLYGLLEPDDGVLSMELAHGGHLSHASRPSSASRRIRARYYGLGADGRIDIDHVATQARACRPRMLIGGASSYPRTIDFRAMREVADDVGALLLADVSHISGLIAAGVHPDPVAHADLVTSSTYKQLGGPHGGFILRGTRSRVDTSAIDRCVFPAFQGTPDFATIAAKAVAFGLAQRPEFCDRMRRVVALAAAMADTFRERSVRMVGGGTDTHMILLDLGPTTTGAQLSSVLESAGLLVNKNLIPDDPRPPTSTSGVRLGTNHLAAGAAGPDDACALATAIADILDLLDANRDAIGSAPWQRLRELCRAYADVRRDPLDCDGHRPPNTR
jgi:glycine hydroxymethyltransferase